MSERSSWSKLRGQACWVAAAESWELQVEQDEATGDYAASAFREGVRAFARADVPSLALAKGLAEGFARGFERAVHGAKR